MLWCFWYKSEKRLQNDNENMIIQNLWDAAKALLRGKLIAIQAYLKKQEKSQINTLTLHLKELEKEEQIKPRVSRRKEIKDDTNRWRDIPCSWIGR